MLRIFTFALVKLAVLILVVEKEGWCMEERFERDKGGKRREGDGVAGCRREKG